MAGWVVSVIVCPNYKDRLFLGRVLVHEMLHAVCHITKSVGITLSNDSEEVYAYMLDKLYFETMSRLA